jgi:uncharacterized protein (TIGR02246 family)
MLPFLAIAAPAIILAWRPDLAAQDKAQDEAALLKNAQAFQAAFEKGDAKGVAALWATDGDYTDQTGKVLKGREAIEKAFQGFFAENKDLKLRIEITALRFVTPDVAIEDGITAVMTPDGAPPSRARYTIVHVKKDGQWQLGSVRDAPFSAASNHEYLRGLEWAIGEWASEGGDKGETARVAFAWAPSQNFIVSSFTTTFKNVSIGGGTQWIGWDPLAKQIRSWTFEDGGGFGEGTWTHEGDKWTIKSKAVLRDAKRLSATNIITRLDADTMTFQMTDLMEDGKSLPGGKTVKLKRIK